MPKLGDPGKELWCKTGKDYRCAILEGGMRRELSEDNTVPDLLAASFTEEKAAKLGSFLCEDCGVRQVIEQYDEIVPME